MKLRSFLTYILSALLLAGIFLFIAPIRAEAKTKQITLSLSQTKNISRKEVVSFESKNKSIATVSKTGKIHGIKAGTTKIIAKTRSGKRTYRIVVKKAGMVYPAFSMMEGEQLNMNCFSQEVPKCFKKWTSTQKTVATVSKAGFVRAKRPGSAYIKVTMGNDAYSYMCRLKVTPKEKSIIYLTFDDGPNRYSTPKILNILKKNKVKATFFELKPAKADFDLTERVLKEGHTLAMHGYQHKYDQIYKSLDIYQENLNKERDLFFRKFGVWCTVTRFPGGSSNTVSRYNPGIMTKITKNIHDWGYHYFDWNVSSGDAGDVKTAAAVYKNVTSGLKKGRSNVVLMHDFNKNDKTINALDRIIKYGKKHGYTFRAITASTAEIHHTVNN